VPARYMERFITAAIGLVCNPEQASGPGDADHHRARIAALLPVYRIKWVCILLNVLLPAGRHRRRLAEGGDLEDHKASQLAKARQALEVIEDQGCQPQSDGAETP